MFFGRMSTVVLAGLIAIAPLGPAQARGGGLLEQLRAGDAKMRGGDCAGGLAIATPLIDDAAFGALPEKIRLAVYVITAWCEGQLNREDAAYRHAVAATALPGAPAQLWAERAEYEFARERHADGVTSIEAAARADPALPNAMRSRYLYWIERQLAADRALDRRFLALFSATTYQPDEPLEDGDLFKRKYAALLIDDGDRAGAAALVARITNPDVLIDLSLDPRLRALLPPDFDARAAFERRLALEREVAASHETLLDPVIQAAGSLETLGRYDEALATLETVRPDGPQGKTFADLKDEANWWWNAVAEAQQKLGHYPQAVVALKAGIEAGEHGYPNVSQMVNLAETQMRFGHDGDALTTLRALQSVKPAPSSFGLMRIHAISGCAHFALGEAAAAKDDLAYVAAHERDGPAVGIALLLCADDLDGAAKVLIRQLDDAEQRPDALRALSDRDPEPASYPRTADEIRLPLLKARADVRAAIARAGGTRRFHIQ